MLDRMQQYVSTGKRFVTDTRGRRVDAEAPRSDQTRYKAPHVLRVVAVRSAELLVELHRLSNSRRWEPTALG